MLNIYVCKSEISRRRDADITVTTAVVFLKLGLFICM